MRFKYLVYLLVFSLLSQTCEDEKTIEFKEINVTTSTNKIVEINIPEAFGDVQISEAINRTINQHIIYSLSLKDDGKIASNTIKESIDFFNKEHENFQLEFPETAAIWEAQIDGEVMYQSEDIISIAITSYLNTGGAHGSLNISFLNFNTQTGQALRNKELFQDYEAFSNVSKVAFNKEIANKKEMYFEPENFILPANIGFNDEGVILLYNTYEIAPYSSGITEINIPWEDLQSALNFL